MTSFYAIIEFTKLLSESSKNYLIYQYRTLIYNLVTKLNLSYTEEKTLSSDSQEKHAEVLGELAREFRQFNGLGASFFRAAAARLGMTVTDMQVMDILDSTGPTTAGQLADFTGLTTG